MYVCKENLSSIVNNSVKVVVGSLLILFISGCSNIKSQNILLVSNTGWYLNGELIIEFDEVKEKLHLLPKDELSLVSCVDTEFDLFIKTMDIVHLIRFHKLELNSNYNSELCK